MRNILSSQDSSGKKPAKSLISVGLVTLTALILLAILNPFYTITSGYVGVIRNFGSVQAAPVYPGLHFRIPFYQSVTELSIQPQTTESHETASTHDLQNVNTKIAVTFHVSAENAPFFYQTFRNFETVDARIISPSVSNDVKAVTARYDAEELVTKRDIVNTQIKELVAQSLSPYHLIVETVNVANFSFSHAYEEAIEAKQVAQQQALQAQYTLQQTQISAQQQVVQAKAAADANVASANGEAQATLVKAQAQSKANELLNQSLTPQVLHAKALERWNGSMPYYLSAGAPLPFIGGGEPKQIEK